MNDNDHDSHAFVGETPPWEIVSHALESKADWQSLYLRTLGAMHRPPQDAGPLWHLSDVIHQDIIRALTFGGLSSAGADVLTGHITALASMFGLNTELLTPSILPDLPQVSSVPYTPTPGPPDWLLQRTQQSLPPLSLSCLVSLRGEDLLRYYAPHVQSVLLLAEALHLGVSEADGTESYVPNSFLITPVVSGRAGESITPVVSYFRAIINPQPELDLYNE